MIRTTELTIIPEGEPIFSERGFTVKIVDEGGGEFITVRDNGAATMDGIRIDLQEWPELRKAIETLLGSIQERG